MAAFTFADFFCGIGGMRLGFESIGGRCVYIMEYNQHALRTYRANFHDFSSIFDASKNLTINTLPEFDVLLAGIPYRPYTLNDIVQVLQIKQPMAFLLENTKTFVTNNHGRIFLNTIDDLKKVGYNVFWKILDSQIFVPQQRERVLIVGFQDTFDFTWPELPNTRHTLSEILHHEGDVLPEDCGKYTTMTGLALPKYTISNKGLELSEKKNFEGLYRVFTPNDISNNITNHYGSSSYRCLIYQGENKNPRRLTPRECARLMGFPDTFIIPVNDTKAYNILCSSVIVPMITWIARGMRDEIKKGFA